MLLVVLVFGGEMLPLLRLLLLQVIPALALPTKAAAFAHCTMFVLGTVMAMGGYTLLIGGCGGAVARDVEAGSRARVGPQRFQDSAHKLSMPLGHCDSVCCPCGPAAPAL